MLKKLYFCQDYDIVNGILTITNPISSINCEGMTDDAMDRLLSFIGNGYHQFIDGKEVTCCFILPYLDERINKVKIIA